jgi:hypothetical protein
MPFALTVVAWMLLGILFLVGVNALRLWLRYVCTVAYRNLRRRFVR